MDPDSQPLGCSGQEGLLFDDQGMVLPHSILGSLEDFRSYLEAKGETELIKRLPKSQRDPPRGRYKCEAVECQVSSEHRNLQSNALQNWNTHMRQRKRQQDYLSNLLNKPTKTLLMNSANNFREVQEQREFLNQVMPFINSGYGYRVGSEFWSLPPHLGDEISGITATLTQTQQGRWKPVTYIGQPSSICRESSAETSRSASCTWNQSSYLQHQYQLLGEFLQDMTIQKPDLSVLEVIGSGKPLTFITECQSPLVEKEMEHEEEMGKSIDPQNNEGPSVLLIPALRFCGQLAHWTGNSATKHGEVGISATIIFEGLTEDIATSHLEMCNEGSTAIFFSWQQLPMTQSFHNLQSQTKHRNFYFNSSSGVILPGNTRRVEFIFKSEKPGIRTEVWQLTTHPVLLQGASLQVVLRGVSLYQDKTSDQRLFIESKLEKMMTVNMCQSILCDVLRGIRSPERPSSPAELYVTEEQRFLTKNPKLQYLYQPVEDLKRLYQKVNPELTWDFSVDTLQQALLSLPENAQDTITKETSLAQLNSLLVDLSKPPELKNCHLTAAAVGHQLWVVLLDRMTDEATSLRNLLGLPENKTWTYTNVNSFMSDGNSTTGEIFNEKSVEDSKKKGKKKEEVGKRTKEKQGRVPSSLTDPESIGQHLYDDPNEEPEVSDIYTRLLHKKVYALMGDLVDDLCGLMDEGAKEDTTWKIGD
ncbi:MYCBP-associated protein-like [Solea solea]|uniref:MYCBP-associated protein-like n=1 Tax=Solea solea TaxID=90069 RepID=UPI00272D045F|nr:MYCBP-associated protein-like [Solea solea]